MQMSVDIEKELSELKDLSIQNNKILKSMQRKSKAAFWFSMLKWTLIIVVSYYSYVILKPTLDQLMVTYNTLIDSAGQISEIKSNIPDPSKLKDLINKQ